MTRVFYDVTFLAALALMLGYVCMWHKHSDVHVTLVFILVPVINLGYCLLGRTTSAEAGQRRATEATASSFTAMM